MSSELYDFVTHFVVKLDDKASFSVAKCVTYIEGCVTAVAFDLKVGERNIIMRALKNTEFHSR